MNKQTSSHELSGFWAMTRDEREKQNERLLDAQRLHLLSPEKRRNYLETLHIHTLVGYSITLEMLSNSAYSSRKEHLHGVLASLSERQEKLSQLLANL